MSEAVSSLIAAALLLAAYLFVYWVVEGWEGFRFLEWLKRFGGRRKG